MTDIALPGSIEPARKGPDLSGAIDPLTGIIFGGIIAAVLLFVPTVSIPMSMRPGQRSRPTCRSCSSSWRF
jgi:hypothetical protein